MEAQIDQLTYFIGLNVPFLAAMSWFVWLCSGWPVELTGKSEQISDDFDKIMAQEDTKPIYVYPFYWNGIIWLGLLALAQVWVFGFKRPLFLIMSVLALVLCFFVCRGGAPTLFARTKFFGKRSNLIYLGVDMFSALVLTLHLYSSLLFFPLSPVL